MLNSLSSHGKDPVAYGEGERYGGAFCNLSAPGIPQLSQVHCFSAQNHGVIADYLAYLRTLQGCQAMTRLAEQHRMTVPWVLESLEQYVRYPLMQKRVTPAGCLGLFRRQVYLDVTLRGKEVTCYETIEGLEVRETKHRVYLLREYRRWQNCYWWHKGQELPLDLRFEPYTPPVCPWIAVA